MGKKKSRTSKTSQGVHGGGGKTTLTEMQKILLGGGRLAAIRPLGSEGARKPRR